eukprot:768521-Hanusia_phi.AAC.7
MMRNVVNPELLDPPSPEQLQSFVDPKQKHTLVLRPEDYMRNPGSAFTLNQDIQEVKNIQQNLQKTHEEAQEAKSAYEQEEKKSAVLRKEYVDYVNKVKQMEMMRRQAMMRGGYPSAQGMGGPGKNLMWGASAQAPQHKNSNTGTDNFVIDSSQMEDPAKEFRANFYDKQVGERRPYLANIERAVRKQSMNPFLATSGMRVAQAQSLRQFTPSRPEVPNRESRQIRQGREMSKMRRDMARLNLARCVGLDTLMARSAHCGEQDVAFREGCPEGTPGCEMFQRTMVQPSASRLQQELRREMQMKTLGDSLVPVEEVIPLSGRRYSMSEMTMTQAENQKPKFLGDGLY